MKRKIVGISIFCLVLGSLFYVNHTKKDSWSNFASNSLTEDSAIQNLATKTDFTWKDSKGDEYPVYIAHTGSCFVIKTSKSGEDYRAYLGEEVSKQIRKELSKSDTRRDRYCFKNRTLKQ